MTLIFAAALREQNWGCTNSGGRAGRIAYRSANGPRAISKRFNPISKTFLIWLKINKKVMVPELFLTERKKKKKC